MVPTPAVSSQPQQRSGNFGPCATHPQRGTFHCLLAALRLNLGGWVLVAIPEFGNHSAIIALCYDDKAGAWGHACSLSVPCHWCGTLSIY